MATNDKIEINGITYTEREGKSLKDMGYSKDEIKNILKLRKLLVIKERIK